MLVAATCLTPGCTRVEPDPPSPQAHPEAEEVDLTPAELPPGERTGPLADRVAEALEDLRAAPSDPAVRLELAKLYDANGLYDSAARTYEQVVHLDPEAGEAWYHLGRCRERLSQWSESRAALERAATTDAGDYPPVHWRSAALYLDANLLEEAERAARRALEVAPEDPTGSIFLARVALQRDDPAEAVRVLTPALARTPEDGLLNTLIGRAFRDLGDPRAPEALAIASESTGAYYDPWHLEVQTRAIGFTTTLDRANALLRDGRPGEAAEIALELFERDPTNVTVQGLLTAALVAQRKFDRAKALLGGVKDDGFSHYRTEMNLGLVHHKSGDPEGALPFLERALELNPSYASGHVYLARVRGELGSWPQAAASLERAVALGQDDLSTLLDAGKAHANGGDLVAAAGAFERARDAHPDAPAAWGYLGVVYVDLERWEQASDVLSRLEALAPEHPLTATVRDRLAAAEASR